MKKQTKKTILGGLDKKAAVVSDIVNNLSPTINALSTTVTGLSTTVIGLSTKVDKLASAMEAGFKRMDEGFRETEKRFKEVKEDNESLARMVANGFEDVREKMATKEDLARLELGQENIQLRVDVLAPQFEVRQLERRVKRLEDKAGIRQK
jgi:hypothetical protein